jgi:hypothetical protein
MKMLMVICAVMAMVEVLCGAHRASRDQALRAAPGEGDVPLPPSAWSSPISTARRLALDSWALQGYAPWAGRRGHATVMAVNTIVLMGGGNGDETYKDVWRSADLGVTWELSTLQASWAARTGMSAVYTGGTIVLTGGLLGGAGINYNDVWRSADLGVTWERSTLQASWAARWGMSAVYTGGTIVLMGGANIAGTFYNDVWRSANLGVTWERSTLQASWAARCDMSAVYTGGTIVLMGGWGTGSTFYNDVWRSADLGVTWELSTPQVSWAARSGMSAVYTGGTIVLTGGLSGTGINYNDVWRSADLGVTWELSTLQASWAARWFMSAVHTGGTIVLMGGSGNAGGMGGSINYNDVWTSSVCSPGQSLNGTSCTLCNVGMYSPLGSTCQSCVAGSFANTPGSITCTACPLGTFNVAPSSTSCSLCPVGYAGITSGAVSCLSCSSGGSTPCCLSCCLCANASHSLSALPRI